MNNETVVLRDSPNLKIVLSENQFEITNEANKSTSGIHFYSLTDSIELKKERTNWLITILSYIVDLLTGSAASSGGRFKEKNRMVLFYKGKRKEISLVNCDIEQAGQLIKNIKSRLT